MKLGSIEPLHLIESIRSKVPESYPLERVVSLLTFCTWIRFPLDPDLVRAAQIAAAASLLLHQKRNEKTFSTPLTVEILAQALIYDSVPGTFAEYFESSEEPTPFIVWFFMLCPEGLKPSLLKARFFIDNGGFFPEEPISRQEQKLHKASPSTLKTAWRTQASSAPFLWAITLEDFSDLSNIVPDNPDDIDAAFRFLADENSCRMFFGNALFCQNRLLRLLDSEAASKITFLQFPKDIEPIDPEVGPFDDAQLKILSSYRAPQ